MSSLKNFELNIQINHSVQPCVQKLRRLPFLMKKQVENKIQKQLEQDFIDPVTSSPKWVSPSVFIPKKDGMCVCLQTCTKLILQLFRNFYAIPTLGEILYEVNGAKIFIKLDLAQGYHQIVLDDKNQEILQLLVLLKDYFDINV